jgi:hypothetical protein
VLRKITTEKELIEQDLAKYKEEIKIRDDRIFNMK